LAAVVVVEAAVVAELEAAAVEVELAAEARDPAWDTWGAVRGRP